VDLTKHMPEKLVFLVAALAQVTGAKFVKAYDLATEAVKVSPQPLQFFEQNLQLETRKWLDDTLRDALMELPQIWHRDLQPLSQMPIAKLTRHITPPQLMTYQQQKLKSPEFAAKSLDLLGNAAIMFVGAEGTVPTVIDLVVTQADGLRQRVSVHLEPGSILIIDRTQIHRGTMYKGKQRRFYIACLKRADVYDGDGTYPLDVGDLMEEVLVIHV
jgi:hypothetical protein